MTTRYRIIGPTMRLSPGQSFNVNDSAKPGTVHDSATHLDDDLQSLGRTAGTSSRPLAERLEAMNQLHREWWNRPENRI